MTASSNDLKLTYVSPAVLTTDAKTLKLHPKKQINQIAKSIETFGMIVPLLVRGHHVEAGYARLVACRQLDLALVPVIDISHLSDGQILVFKIADNQLCHLGQWDDDFLAKTLKDLSEQELDFTLDVTGFDCGEIDFRIQSLDEPAKEDEMPPQPPGAAVTKRGDLWLLDRHRLICGDTLVPDTAAQLMAGKKATMVFADEPYNVPISGHVTKKTSHREFAMAVGELSASEFGEFLVRAYQVGARHSTNGSLHYHCIDWRHAFEALIAGYRVFGDLKNICVWDKMVAALGSHYKSQHEFVLVFKSGKAAHQNNIQLGKNKRNRSNVWSYPGANSMRHSEENAAGVLEHPTVKPIRLVADVILDSTKRGDIVLDTFLGSGTTLLAAERTKRICYGIEIDPRYVDLAIRRWQQHSGGVAIHALTGKTFDLIERELADAA